MTAIRLKRHHFLARESDTTLAAQTAGAISATEPTDQYIALPSFFGSDAEGRISRIQPMCISVLPFGDVNNGTFSIDVEMWKRDNAGLHIPFVIGTLACTVSTYTGLAGGMAVVADLFCDTIVWTPTALGSLSAANLFDYVVHSPANNTPAIFHIIGGMGFDGIRLRHHTYTTATKANSLVSFSAPA